MIEELYELLAMLQEKHPNDRADGFVKILLYSDGSGSIYDKPISENDALFSFSSLEELVDWLETGSIPEPTERE